MSEHSSSNRGIRVVREVATWSAIVVGTLLFLEGCASAVLFLRDRPNVPSAERPVRPRTLPDTLLGWRNVAAYANANEYGKNIGLHITPDGLRSTPSSGAAAAPGIVCSGDSFTFGVGVADDRTWCALLAAELGVPTFTMAQENHGVDQAYLWYRRDGARLPHRVQVLALTNAMLERSASPDDNGWHKPRLELDGDALATRGVPVTQTRDALEDAAFDRRLASLRIAEALRLLPPFDAERAVEKRIDERRPVVEAVLRDLAARHAARGTRLVVAYLPTGSERRSDELAARRQWLGEVAKRRGIAFVDLTPVFRALRPDSLDLAFISRTSPIVVSRAGGQYSPLAHAVVARALATELRPLLAPVSAAPPRRAPGSGARAGADAPARVAG